MIYYNSVNEWTIQKLLDWMKQYFEKKGLDNPRLCTELLLSHTLQMKRIELYTNFDKTVNKDQLDELRELVKRAAQHEPIAYLTGKCEFYSLEFYVSPVCLIPRPETELLVEHAIEFLRRRYGEKLVCDIGTGSGCIAVAIAKNCPDAKIIATDISDKALNVAKQNVDRYQLADRIRLLQGDLFEPIIQPLDLDKEGFDLIVCNPPYVSADQFKRLERNVREYEPKLALWAGENGLDIHRRIAEQVGKFLKKDAALMMEIGYDQADKVKELLERTHLFSKIIIEKDYQKNDRIVIASR